ncbi:BatD family protein [Rubritalea marina]|uniref:BatD family protein n=1 Tax=Rubritalea marina TaxID=361055 RepID=UPI0003804A4B|nr:BatD family protein [Rubritalea marina]
MNHWFFVWLVCLGSLTAAEQVVVRSSVVQQEAWQGQRVRLIIEVLGKDSWAQIPNMPVIKIPGAYVLPPSSQGVRAQETIDGASYTGQRYELSVYPQRGGTIEIPAQAVEVSMTVFGSSADPAKQQTQIPAASFKSNVPPGAQGIDWLVSTSQFDAQQTWSSESDEFQVGDALTRSITLHAADVSGMAFKPLEYPPMQGLGIYPAEPSVDDQRDRGRLSGTRKEEVSYIFQGAGTVVIPALELQWWDVQNEKLHKIVLEGRELQISGGAGASYVEQGVGVQASGGWKLALLVLVALAGLLWWRWQVIVAYVSAKRARAREHEKHDFARFAEVAASGDIAGAQGALMHWLDRINESVTPARLEPFLKEYAGDGYRCEELIHQPVQLYQVMVKARKNWQREGRRRKKAESLLPPLNG